jgi:hypothetical protein
MKVGIMIRLDSEIAEQILANCSARTDKAIRDQLGISYNTFRKIERGESIRRSLALRLQEGFSKRLSGEMHLGQDSLIEPVDNDCSDADCRHEGACASIMAGVDASLHES